jgi:homoserine dehydrogenase
LGYGRVGQAVAAVAERSRERLEAAGVELRFTGALVRDLHKSRSGPPVRLSRDAASVLTGVDVAVEVLGGVEPAWTLVESALRARIPVVTANKTLVARYGQELARTAARHGTTFVFDAAVLAGVPFLGSLARRPLISQARHLAGIVNGTSQFIVSALNRGMAFEPALAEAITRGYAEPDSEADTSGRDAAEKLTILLHLAGYPRVAVADLPCTRLEVLDPRHLSSARQLGGAIKPVALASIDPRAPGAWVGPAFVDERHLFASLGGVTNALEIAIDDDHAVTFAGPGAGPDVTAVTILDDIVEAVTAPRPEAGRVPTAGFAEVPPHLSPAVFRQPPAGCWFVAAKDGGGTGAAVDRAVPSARAVRADDWAAVVTTPADWPAIDRAVAGFRQEGRQAIALPVIAHRS